MYNSQSQEVRACEEGGQVTEVRARYSAVRAQRVSAKLSSAVALSCRRRTPASAWRLALSMMALVSELERVWKASSASNAPGESTSKEHSCRRT